MEILQTFQIIHKDDIISPLLTTTREYGRWMQKVFDNCITDQTLYMHSKKNNLTGKTLESHPGTKIGKFFDSHTFKKSELHSWYILKDSKPMNRLVDYNLAELRDTIPISVNDKEHRMMLRVYTVKQIEMYIRSEIDKDFNIASYIDISKQIKVSDKELTDIIMPEIKEHRTGLFN